MKKILAMIMALVLMLSLCACGAKTEAPAPAPAPAETPAETPAEAPAEEVTWPEYPVSLVVAASAGGGTDLCARVMAEELSTYGGASFGVVNQTEGSGVVAYEQVLSSDPEACDTLLYYLSGMYLTHASGSIDMHPIEDYETVFCATLGTSCYLVSNKNAPYQTFEELVEYTHEHPGEVKIGNAVAAGTGTLLIGHIENETGIEWSMVAAESDSVAIGQVIGGNLDLYIVNQSTANSYLSAGEVNVLACVNDRSEVASDILKAVPTLEDLGYTNSQIKNNFIVLAPKGADPAVYEKMNEWFNKAMLSDRVQADFAERSVSYNPVGDLETTQAFCKACYDDMANLWQGYLEKYGG